MIEFVELNLLVNRWLEQFAYKTNVSIAIFFVALVLVAVVVIVSVLYQDLEAATVNPVKVLKDK